MRLYLVQHGEACTKQIDPERPLTDQGKADINRLASFLQQAAIRVECVIHSGKLRAQQTAECLAKSIAPDVKLEISNLINPNDAPDSFDWQSICQDRNTLVVGHLPFLEKWLSVLLLGDEKPMISAYQPGSMVCLESDQGQWRIKWMLSPELLKYNVK
ncbi:MAG: phosphohistidine phosphatase SixA [Gammaproteobacteria bacterium]|nr:phosphohistidine phosphatase SixA [Gammaproteobacteria bacterium]